MKLKHLISYAFLFYFITSFGQNTMRIYHNSMFVKDVPIIEIDSVTYTINPNNITSIPGSGVTHNGVFYKSVILGNGQEWFTQNLRTENFANGDPIQNVPDPLAWSNLTSPAWVYPNNDFNSDLTFGKMYNWYTIVDNRQVCPYGWHVPTDSNWLDLRNYLGGELVAGGKMAATNAALSSVNLNKNEAGMFVFYAENRFMDGTFNFWGTSADFWSNSEISVDSSFVYELTKFDDALKGIVVNKKSGNSIRCLKD